MAKTRLPETQDVETLIKLSEAFDKANIKIDEYAKNLELAFLSQEKFIKLTEELTDAKIALHQLETMNEDAIKDKIVHERLMKQFRDKISVTEEVIKKLKEVHPEMDLYNKSIETGIELISKLTGLNKEQNTIYNKFFNILGDGKNAVGLYVAGLKTAFNEMFNIGNIYASLFGTMISNTVKFAIEADNQISAFQKSTGIVDVYTTMMHDAYRANIDLGVSMADISDATKSLTDNFQKFSIQTMSAKQELVEFTATQTRLGVSSENSSKLFSYYIDTLGQSVEAAERNTLSINQMANALNINLNKAISDFNSLLPDMIKYSEKATEVFIKLSSVSKIVGVDVKDLYNAVKNFDTFEDAAKSVGRLNAILGGPFLNSMTLLRANDEADRVEIMARAFQETNRTWESLGKYEKQAIAVASGISDMSILQKLFTTDLSNFDSVLSETNMTMKENQERAERTASITEKLRILTENLMFALEPVIDVFRFLIDVVIEVSKAFNVFSEKWSWVGDILKIGLLVGIFLAIKWIKNLGLTLLNFGGIASKIGGLISSAFGKISSAATSVAKAFSNVATGIGGIIKSVLTSIADGLIAFSNPKVLIGAAVLAGTIVLIGGAIAAVGALAGAGLSVLAEGITAISKAFSGGDSDLEKRRGMADLTERLSNIPPETSNKIDKITSSIKSLGKALSEFSLFHIIAFNSLMDMLSEFSINSNIAYAASFTGNMSDMIVAAQNLDIEHYERVSKLLDQVKTSTPTQGNSTVQTSGNLFQHKPQAEKPTEVILQINEKEFGRAVINMIEGKYNLAF